MTVPEAMDEPVPAAGEVLVCEATAIPAHATTLRHVLTDWARTCQLPVELVEDVRLAAYEALANVVEHAYPPDSEGPLTLTAQLHNMLTVAVSDHGHWRNTYSTPGRGRGLPLIRTLAPDTHITHSDTGTALVMTWPAPPPNDHRQPDAP